MTPTSSVEPTVQDRESEAAKLGSLSFTSISSAAGTNSSPRVSSPFITLKNNQENITSASSDRDASVFESSNCSYQSSQCGSPNTTTRTSLCASCAPIAPEDSPHAYGVDSNS
jgi:hypothetical protein